MDFEMVWQKIVEFAMMFYNYAMTQGEINFEQYNFLSPIVMVLAAIFACDSFDLEEDLSELKSKNSIVNVLIFTTAVFSFHIFYKMLVGLVGGFLGADASIRALDCLGSFINPIAIMIYAFAICTVTFKRPWQWGQALMLGLAIFFTPSVISFDGFTNEHIAICATAGVIALTGGILHAVHEHKHCSPVVACFVLDIVYFVSKYFMIFYSDEVKLITASDNISRVRQYLACEMMDLIFALILLLVLLAYKVASTENVSIKKNVIFPIILAVFTVTAVLFEKLS